MESRRDFVISAGRAIGLALGVGTVAPLDGRGVFPRLHPAAIALADEDANVDTSKPTDDETETAEGDYEYVIRDDYAVITSYQGDDTDLVIPSELGGQTVRGLADGAFYGCKHLASVTIPDSVTTLGDTVFNDCDALASLAIPAPVTTIRGGFLGCKALEDIEVDPGNETYAFVDGVLFDTAANSLVFLPASHGTSYEVPDGTMAIGAHALSSARLKSITLPSSLTEIGDFAFTNCSLLASVTIPASVTSIGKGAFAAYTTCQFLESLEVDPANETFSIADGALIDNASKRIVCLPTKCGATSYSIPEGITVIDDLAFSWCESLASVEIPSSVTTIGEDAFIYSGLISVEIPFGVTSIGERAFLGCKSLTSVSIPDSVTFIGRNAFTYCTSLPTIEVPAGATVPESFYRGPEIITRSGSAADESTGEKGETGTTTSSDAAGTPTMGQQNALDKAHDYLNFMSFSREGLIDQLEFEGFTADEAAWAADNCGADWNEQAALKAQEYLDLMSFSRSELIDQLEFEGFTSAQAEYGARAAGY